MKKNEVQIGGVYTAKVSDKVVQVRIEGERGTGWSATNLTTGKTIHIKSAQRLREAVSGSPESATKTPTLATGAKQADQGKENTKSEKAATRAKRGDQNAKKNSGLSAAARVLAESKEPMGARDIVNVAFEKGYWNSKGKTPHATVYSAMIREISEKGKESRFRKVQRGKFAANS